MADNNIPSVYSLVTMLCKSLAKGNANVDIIKMRKRAFEIILYYHSGSAESLVWEHYNSYQNEFLALQYILRECQGLNDDAEQIDNCIATIQNSQITEESLNRVLHFLLKIKNVPELEKYFTKEDKISQNEVGHRYRVFNESDFTLKHELVNRFSNYTNESFCLSKRLSDNECNPKSNSSSDTYVTANEYFSNHSIPQSELSYKIMKPFSNIIVTSTSTQPETVDTESDSDESEYGLVMGPSYKSITHRHLELWQDASHGKLDVTNWETSGSQLLREKPFLVESCTSHVNTYELTEIKNNPCLPKDSCDNFNVLSHQEFIKHLVYLVLGLESKSFTRLEDNTFILNSDVMLQGMQLESLKDYCKLLIECATCYTALVNMCTECLQGSGPIKSSIYNQLCTCVNEYLVHYRVSVLNVGEKEGIMQFHRSIRNLSFHLLTIASICKVGIYLDKENPCPPTSVELLNYLYNQGEMHANTDVQLVVYSVFFPCVQIYLRRFVGPWLFTGELHDPYLEFFIQKTDADLKDRTFWTNGFELCKKLIPDFLTDFAKDIFTCGKEMHLLKMCVPDSTLCYMLDKGSYNLIFCCTTGQELSILKYRVRDYELDVRYTGTGLFTIKKMMMDKEKEQLLYLQEIAEKRASTLNAIQLKRMEELRKFTEAKNKLLKDIREEYDRVMELKNIQSIANLAQELERQEAEKKLEEERNKIIQEEAQTIVAHYDKLMAEADALNQNIGEDTNTLKNIQTPSDNQQSNTTIDDINANTSIEQVNNNETDNDNNKQQDIPVYDTNAIKYTVSPTVLKTEKTKAKQNVVIKSPEPTSHKEELTEAQRNKMKVMGRTDMEAKPPEYRSTLNEEGKRNRLKVLGTEFGLDLEIEPIKEDHNYKSISRKSSTHSFNGNESYVSALLDTFNSGENYNVTLKPNTQLFNYDFCYLNTLGASGYEETVNEKILDLPPRNRLRKLRQLRTCDTEVAYLFSNNSPTEFSYLKIPKFKATTSELLRPIGLRYEQSKEDEDDEDEFGKLDAFKSVTTLMETLRYELPSLDYYIADSITVPLHAHWALAKNEVLKYFVVDLKYFEYLERLRNYYFLLEGEYSHNLIEGLFGNLYTATDPKDVLTIRSLITIFNCAVDPSHDSQGFHLRMEKVPDIVDLGNVNTCDCLTLTFSVQWPLNILLPFEVIKKYDEVFKFLLKIHQINFVLKNIFKDMKTLNKQYGRKSYSLIRISSHYHKLQIWRHAMTDFIQIFQNYILGEVFQSSWSELQTAFLDVDNIDDLYNAHSNYIKKIHFLCLLNHKAAPLRKIVINIFHVILKYYEYYRSREWTCDNMEFTHPNFDKLEEIYKNFISLTEYFYKAGQKIVRVGYQKQFAHLIDLLNINNFYSQKRN